MNTAKRWQVGIVGAAGYTGGELIRLLLHHPNVELAFLASSSQAGKPLHAVHTDLLGETDRVFDAEYQPHPDVLFLCSGHGEAKKFLAAQPVPESTLVIDLSHDYRLRASHSGEWTYALPELRREDIRSARRIANPGCFATAIELALLPLAAQGLLSDSIHINATTGSTGAGQSLSATSHFSWRHSNFSVYKAFTHQHLGEIGQSLGDLQPGFDQELLFIPNRGSFTRGILASVYTRCALSLEEAFALYEGYYATHPFTWLSRENPDLKQVVGTNKAVLYLEKHGDYLLIISLIDNLLKGASGQAVQNMNLALGLEESTGLHLKALAF